MHHHVSEDHVTRMVGSQFAIFEFAQRTLSLCIFREVKSTRASLFQLFQGFPRKKLKEFSELPAQFKIGSFLEGQGE